MRYFPVIAVMVGSGPVRAKQVQVIAIDSVHGPGAGFFWSAMHMGANQCLETVDLPEELVEMGNGTDRETEQAMQNDFGGWHA